MQPVAAAERAPSPSKNHLPTQLGPEQLQNEDGFDTDTDTDVGGDRLRRVGGRGLQEEGRGSR
jgi:hypothetical protein